MRKLILWMAENPALTVSLCLLTVFLLLNLLAYRHARAMTHFVPANGRTHRRAEWRDGSYRLSLLEKVQLAVNGITVERPAEDARPDRLGLRYEDHLYSGGAGRLAAWYIPRERSAGLIALFHGYGADKARLLPEARAFHELGYSCFLVDFRGSGDSDGRRTSIGYYEAEDVERTVKYVRSRWPNERLILFGQSMGAAAVLRALSRQTIAADAVVLECPFDRLLSAVAARFASTGLPSFPAARLMIFWGGVQHGFNGFTHNPADYARQVSCPTLLLHGSGDRRVYAEHIQSIYQNLAGAKELHRFEGLGHESYAASRPEEWLECVRRFLHQHVRAG
jgi:alpha-beta hydrolase superfamily lysophospholipase